MKRLALLLMTIGLALAPMAPARPPADAVAVQICALDCCRQPSQHAGENSCATACECADSCLIPAQTNASLPAVTRVCPPSSGDCRSETLSDEFAAERTTRPPVPPPRA